MMTAPASTSVATCSPPPTASSSTRSLRSRAAVKMAEGPPATDAGLAGLEPAACMPPCGGRGGGRESRLAVGRCCGGCASAACSCHGPAEVQAGQQAGASSLAPSPHSKPQQPLAHHAGVVPALLHKVPRPPPLQHPPLIHCAVDAGGEQHGVVCRPPQPPHLQHTAHTQMVQLVKMRLFKN